MKTEVTGMKLWLARYSLEHGTMVSQYLFADTPADVLAIVDRLHAADGLVLPVAIYEVGQ